MTYEEATVKERGRANDLVFAAVHSGLILKPKRCEECLGIKEVHGHHEDYAKPLAVNWLCRTCHKKRHPKNKRSNLIGPSLVDKWRRGTPVSTKVVLGKKFGAEKDYP